MTTHFKIKVENADLLRKAKKITFVGFNKADGVGIYKTMSYDNKEDLTLYLEDLDITLLSLSRLSTNTG